MKATVDISLYPLSDGYRDTIYSFIGTLRHHPGIDVETDGMRTQLIGDYDVLMGVLQNEMREVLKEGKAVFVIKLARGERTKGSPDDHR